jgi:hypothetical protein
MIYRFDPIDRTQMQLVGKLTPAQRLQLMLRAREMAVSLKRARLRRRYADLSSTELNLKLLEELSNVRTASRP